MYIASSATSSPPAPAGDTARASAYNPGMTPQAIDEELTREPFAPIRLHVSDGHSYLISNPGLCTIMRGTLYIARVDRPKSRLLDDMDAVDCAHVTRVEQVDDAASGKGGARPKRR
jgi:hypothetical protein